MGKRTKKPDFERSIPGDLDDSDWWMREGRAMISETAFWIMARHASCERAEEDRREIRTGKLMR